MNNKDNIAVEINGVRHKLIKDPDAASPCSMCSLEKYVSRQYCYFCDAFEIDVDENSYFIEEKKEE